MQRRPSDLENKLLLLHAVDRLGAVTAPQLLAFMAENDGMDYITLQLCLAELDDAGLLRRRPHALGMLYTLTGEGLDTLSMFRARVPHSRLEGINRVADNWRIRFRRERQMLSDFERAPNGDYAVRLRVMERNEPLLDMTISVPTHGQAQRMCDAWAARAGDIYAHIMHALGEEPTPQK